LTGWGAAAAAGRLPPGGMVRRMAGLRRLRSELRGKLRLIGGCGLLRASPALAGAVAAAAGEGAWGVGKMG
jgi:hypothetical protein